MRPSLIVACSMVAVIAMAAVGCFRPPLRITKDGDAVRIDVQTLGEYPTTIAKVRLLDATSDAVIWEVRARGGAQLSTFELKAGANQRAISHVAWGNMEAVTPQAPTFTIDPSRPYIIEVWGTGLVVTRSRARFSV